eukprot:758443-Hanusia_phi.AAC.7
MQTTTSGCTTARSIPRPPSTPSVSPDRLMGSSGRRRGAVQDKADPDGGQQEGMIISGGQGDAFDARGCGRRHVVEDPEVAICSSPRASLTTEEQQKGYLMFVEGVNKDGKHSIGLYTSSDGLKWERSSDKPVFDGSNEEGAWDAENVGCPWVVPMEDGSCRTGNEKRSLLVAMFAHQRAEKLRELRPDISQHFTCQAISPATWLQTSSLPRASDILAVSNASPACDEEIAVHSRTDLDRVVVQRQAKPGISCRHHVIKERS